MKISDFYSLNPTEYSSAIIIFNLFFSLILLLCIVYLYKKTRHGLSHSQSFIFSVVLFGLLSTAIMMAVQNNIIGAFAIFSAFTLVRFRSILKEPSDLAYIFFSLVTGITVGMSHYALAVITVVFMVVVIIAFHKWGFGKIVENFDYLLILVTDKQFKINDLKNKLDEHAIWKELLHVKNYENKDTEYSVALHIKETEDLSRIMDQLSVLPMIKKVELLTGKSSSEY